MSKRIDPGLTRTAVLAVEDWVRDPDSVEKPARPLLADAVRRSARLMEHDAPGHSVEVRVPPFVAVQVIDGPRHTRGTPPNIVETDPLTWLQLVTGTISFDEAVSQYRLEASGTRAGEIARMLPLIPLG